MPKAGKGRARGVAVHKSFDTYVAQIAEVSRGKDGLPKVEHVWCAVDCGVAVNPDIIKAQMEGGIGFGLGAILFDEITLDQGRVVQGNFNDYRMLRIHEMPKVDVVIVKSAEKPTGVGEPGVPPIGPAVANAWRALTGKAVRHPAVQQPREIRASRARSVLGDDDESHDASRRHSPSLVPPRVMTLCLRWKRARRRRKRRRI